MDSFEQLVLRYEARVFYYVRSGCSSDADAADITQASFVSAYLALERFEVGRPFAPWLFQIARRKLLDQLRGRVFEPLESAPESVDSTDPGQELADWEEQRQLWSEIRMILPEKQSAALWFRYREEMSMEEVAASMAISVTHAKVLLFRARRALLRHWRQAGARRAEDLSFGPFGPSTRYAEVKS